MLSTAECTTIFWNSFRFKRSVRRTASERVEAVVNLFLMFRDDCVDVHFVMTSNSKDPNQRVFEINDLTALESAISDE